MVISCIAGLDSTLASCAGTSATLVKFCTRLTAKLVAQISDCSLVSSRLEGTWQQVTLAAVMWVSPEYRLDGKAAMKIASHRVQHFG